MEYYTTSFKAEIFTQIYLDEAGCSRDLSVEVLLSLLLLDFKGKPWAQDTLIGKRIRIDCIDSYRKKICHYEVVYTFSVQVVECSCKFHGRNSFFLFSFLHYYISTVILKIEYLIVLYYWLIPKPGKKNRSHPSCNKVVTKWSKKKKKSLINPFCSWCFYDSD